MMEEDGFVVGGAMNGGSAWTAMKCGFLRLL